MADSAAVSNHRDRFGDRSEPDLVRLLYDIPARLRHGTAPPNLAATPYASECDTKMKVG